MVAILVQKRGIGRERVDVESDAGAIAGTWKSARLSLSLSLLHFGRVIGRSIHKTMLKAQVNPSG